MPKLPIPISPEVEASIRQLLEQGHSVTEMAEIMEMPYDALHYKMRKLGLSIRRFKNRPVPPELIVDWTYEEILSLKEKNYSTQSIAAAYHTTRQYIESMLSEKKVTKKFERIKIYHNHQQEKEIRQRELERQKKLMWMGWDCNQIVDDIGIPITTVFHRAASLGLSFRGIKETRDNTEIPFSRIKNRTYQEIISLLDDGYTKGGIANAYGVDVDTIGKFVNQGFVSDQFTNHSHPDLSDHIEDLFEEVNARYEAL